MQQTTKSKSTSTHHLHTLTHSTDTMRDEEKGQKFGVNIYLFYVHDFRNE